MSGSPAASNFWAIVSALPQGDHVPLYIVVGLSTRHLDFIRCRSVWDDVKGNIANPKGSQECGSGKFLKELVGPNGLEPSTSSVSRKRSNQTELRAYAIEILRRMRD